MAAERTTWQLWEAECEDTIWTLAEKVELDFSDWPRWLSLERAAPGAHALPDRIQPGDVYKVKRYAAIIGGAIPRTHVYAKAFSSHFDIIANDKGNYGIIYLHPKLWYLIFNPWYYWDDENGDEHATESGKYFKKYYFRFDYGEVKRINFPIPMPHSIQ